MPRKAACPNPRRPDQVDLATFQALREDPELWTADRIREELATSRTTIHRLLVRTKGYLDGSRTSWPPGADDSVSGAPLTWWPPHHAALPPPDAPGAQPRWRAGNVRAWAMRTGRMDVDGTPLKYPTKGGSVEAQVEKAEPFDQGLIDQVEASKADGPLWTSADIVEGMGVTAGLVGLWYRRTRNRCERGLRTWPPSASEVGLVVERGSPLPWWPDHQSLLPAPDLYHEYRSSGRQYPVWRKGTIARWALRTGRCRIVDGALTLRNSDDEGEGP